MNGHLFEYAFYCIDFKLPKAKISAQEIYDLFSDCYFKVPHANYGKKRKYGKSKPQSYLIVVKFPIMLLSKEPLFDDRNIMGEQRTIQIVRNSN